MKIPILRWHVVDFTLKSATVSYLNTYGAGLRDIRTWISA